MDNALSQYLQQKNQLQAPEQANASLVQGQSQDAQQPDDSLVQLAQSKQQLQNVLQAYQQGKVGGGVVSAAQAAFAGQCQKWAELQTLGHAGVYPSAIAAAGHYAQAGQLNPNVTQAPKGSLIYFNADQSNGGAGHVAISNGDGTMTGATYNGIQTTPLSAWIQSTKQQPLGYVIPNKN